jgi:PTS HPr component phosphorylation site
MNTLGLHLRAADEFVRLAQEFRSEVTVIYEDHWVPSSPILGCKVLTVGQAMYHPTEGKVVRFPQALRRRRRTTTIAVRTTQRPDLLELFGLAVEMEAEHRSEVEAAQRSRRPSGVTCDHSALNQS